MVLKILFLVFMFGKYCPKIIRMSVLEWKQSSPNRRYFINKMRMAKESDSI